MCDECRAAKNYHRRVLTKELHAMTNLFAPCPPEVMECDERPCRGKNTWTEWCHEGEGYDAKDSRVAAAVRLCHTCPVEAACREWAMTSPDPCRGYNGGLVAGGLTLRQRDQIRLRGERSVA